ncbi:protein-L-isoaspartate(D-aspartate) O-methyltransferase [Pseudoalteromonas sp. DL2-H2.2]|uniref:protein-L-isoaspartate(D-aspartate) O-methyltransferase n=1 Tax=Pseudoalteromonas sp. DL2-H2.2 TaxID=2908889 RepID=UPI001F3571BD|nr:protein-L-isoaspartate(D-aspartate) O-methyltransferase [Pseudoalteromonas sp. DL2-H2.2]MCF2908311.1 protein-L-isoaspartate(D-aspartate) O-methyltransferase [Pseudoalteromonas sp. DL2-H2.2]
MLKNYKRSAEALVATLGRHGISDPEVLNCLEITPRHLFVDTVLQHKSYENTALPIGQGQTISQPLVVARMTELLRQAGVRKKILEVGTGSGYQTAVLAQLFDEVYSIERIKALQWQAKRRLHMLDLYNVAMKHGDGWQGWASKGPYDGIIVTAAAAQVPQALLEQLADGGVMVIPVGEQYQVLTLYQRQGQQFIENKLAEVRFVPLVPGALS